jgi:hypothetical protein
MRLFVGESVNYAKHAFDAIASGRKAITLEKQKFTFWRTRGR